MELLNFINKLRYNDDIFLLETIAVNSFSFNTSPRNYSAYELGYIDAYRSFDNIIEGTFNINHDDKDTLYLLHMLQSSNTLRITCNNYVFITNDIKITNKEYNTYSNDLCISFLARKINREFM